MITHRDNHQKEGYRLPMPATRPTISIVQLYVRRDQMMANLRSIRSFDASVALLSPEDCSRYFDEPEQAEQAEQATDLLAVWTACLEREAADLDLSDADDRATFRGRVSSAFANAKIDVVQQVAAGLGIEAKRDRAAACRVVADELIRRAVSRTTMTAEGTAQAEADEAARVAKKATVRTGLAAVLIAVAACDATPVADGFVAPPAPGITSAASTDAPTSSSSTGDDDDDDADASTATGDEPLPDTTTTGADASTSTAALDTTGDAPASSTTTDDAGTTAGDDTSGEASTGDDITTGDDMIGTSTGSTGDDSTTGAADESSTGEPLPVELPPECLDYVPLTDASRNITTPIWHPKSCDKAMAVGWYRFMGEAGTRMPMTPPPIYSSGTHAPGWMDGTHPTVADGIVERTVCYHWDNDGDGPLPDKPCWVSTPLQVRNCGAFFVYHLTASQSCMTRFASEDV